MILFCEMFFISLEEINIRYLWGILFKILYTVVLIRSIFFNKDIKKNNNIRIGIIVYISLIAILARTMLIVNPSLD